MFNTTTLIHISQYNRNKLNIEKKIGDVDKKIPNTGGLVTKTVLNTEISEVESKRSDTTNLMSTTVLN